MRSAKLETVLEDLSPYLPQPGADGDLKKARVLSLLYPTPDFAGDHEKLEIAMKNVLSALDDEANGPAQMRQQIRSVVASLTASDMPGGGIAVFSDGNKAQYMALSEAPMPYLHLGEAAVALPVLLDAQESRRFWIAVLDVERPVLYHVADGRVQDRTPEDVQTLSQTMKQYHPMADVTWHSSGGVRRSGAPAQFHALGTATEDLRNDEMNRVLRSFAKQVESAVTGPDPVLLAGGPSRLGHFREHFEHRNLIDRDIQAAGDAQDEDELLKRAFEVYDVHAEASRKARLDELDLSAALTSLDELLTAAHEGRLERMLVRRSDSGLLSGDDERLKLQPADEDMLKRSKAVAYAAKHGAELLLVDELDTVSGLMATTRYDS
jgi:hypothetical protein